MSARFKIEDGAHISSRLTGKLAIVDTNRPVELKEGGRRTAAFAVVCTCNEQRWAETIRNELNKAEFCL